MFAALTEPRPHREAFSRSEAARIVQAEVRGGRLDAEAVNAVVEAAGLPREAAPAGPTTSPTARSTCSASSPAD